jgi:2'-5' RNA ligase
VSQPEILPRQRVFFALWPDALTAAALGRAAQEAARACGGRPTRPQTIHLTLAFIGNVPVDRVMALQQLAALVEAPCFDLQLDHIGFWRHNRIVWAGAGGVPQALTLLASRLNGLLREADFRVEDRSFAAHVSLLRKADCRGGAERQIAFAPLRWPVTEFVLVESVLRPEGASYRPLARFGLQGL